MRYFIKFAYNGTNYHGWQSQPNAASVQETLSKAVSVILNSDINLMGAGRTDTGVHAKVMFAHFDIESDFNLKTTVHKLNSYLPKDISVFDIISVQNDAHVRFDAKKRTYEYHIHHFKDVFADKLSWYYQKELDVDLMNQAAKLLLNHQDFECFSKVNTDVFTFNCEVTEAYWTRGGAEQSGAKPDKNQLIFTISANRFLRNMVRAIVGTLIKVGLHKISIADFNAIIESKKRSKAGFSVPAHGLYLTEIEYDYLKKEN